MKVPHTDFSLEDLVYFKTCLPGKTFEIEGKQARIVEFKDSPNFPHGIAVCIQFTLLEEGFYLRRTWVQVDEIFPYPPQQ